MTSVTSMAASTDQTRRQLHNKLCIRSASVVGVPSNCIAPQGVSAGIPESLTALPFFQQQHEGSRPEADNSIERGDARRQQGNAPLHCSDKMHWYMSGPSIDEAWLSFGQSAYFKKHRSAR